ncbi:MAG TPA: transglycosylase SLT domain-containing protein [Terriglobales bacterium]|nr:transglycosylase SLT domain-containing protein [Terriglobales bacterium]
MFSWRKIRLRPTRIHASLLRASLFLFLGLTVLPSVQAGDRITAIRDENGRTVYVNDESAPVRPTKASARTAPRSSARYVYWSNAERRWIPVKRPSYAALTAARSAAAEVQSYVSSQPKGRGASDNPNYRTLATGYQVSSAEIDRAIEEAAQKHNVDPNLVRAIVKVESNFNSRAVSRKGAMGLMQLMPATARSLNVTNPFDPKQNVEAGVRHLKELLANNNGDVPLSLAAYNAGQGAVNRNNGVPPYRETRDYVKRITELYWNGAPGRFFTSTAAPIRISRNPNGVLRITNTE